MTLVFRKGDVMTIKMKILFQYLILRVKVFFNFLMLNIHTILLFVGIAFIALAAFLFNQIIGFLVLGIALIVVSYLINMSVG